MINVNKKILEIYKGPDNCLKQNISNSLIMEAKNNGLLFWLILIKGNFQNWLEYVTWQEVSREEDCRLCKLIW